MRDSSEGMIELIEAYEENGLYFSVIEIPKNENKARFCFGINPDAYKSLRKILQSRPLDRMPGLKYKYFYTGSISKHSMKIRCEVGNTGASFDYDVPQELIANLRWFNEIKSFEDAKHLRI